MTQKSEVKSKRCPKCNCKKELSDYNKDRTKKDGLQAYCRKCSVEAVKANAPRKEYHKSYALKYYHEKIKNHPLRKAGLTITELKKAIKLSKEA